MFSHIFLTSFVYIISIILAGGLGIIGIFSGKPGNIWQAISCQIITVQTGFQIQSSRLTYSHTANVLGLATCDGVVL